MLEYRRIFTHKKTGLKYIFGPDNIDNPKIVATPWGHEGKQLKFSLLTDIAEQFTLEWVLVPKTGVSSNRQDATL